MGSLLRAPWPENDEKAKSAKDQRKIEKSTKKRKIKEKTTKNAEVTLERDQDGTYLLSVNGHPVGRLLQDGGLDVADVRIVTPLG